MTTIVTRTPVEIVELWIKALRSGEYKPGKLRLRRENTFCCLGVLCDLARKDGGDDWKEIHDLYHFGKDRETHYLPKQFQEYLELKSSTLSQLMRINDAQDDPFPTIAIILEKTVLPRLKGKA